MALWQVRTDEKFVYMGDRRRPKMSQDACNEPFKASYWCPRRQWFFREPCPFRSRGECENFRRMCGAL